MKFNLETPETSTPSDISPEVNEDVRDVSDRQPDIANDISEFSDAMHEDLENCKEAMKEVPAKEYGLSECTDATIEIFTPEVIDNWREYSHEQKSEITNEYANAIVDGLNIDFEGVVFEEMDEYTFGYTQREDGYIHLNENMLDGYGPYDVVDTVAHELRHQLQMEAIDDPEKFGIDGLIVSAWEYGECTYFLENYDFEYYMKNPMEVDARYFADSMVDALLYTNENA